MHIQNGIFLVKKTNSGLRSQKIRLTKHKHFAKQLKTSKQYHMLANNQTTTKKRGKNDEQKRSTVYGAKNSRAVHGKDPFGA